MILKQAKTCQIGYALPGKTKQTWNWKRIKCPLPVRWRSAIRLLTLMKMQKYGRSMKSYYHIALFRDWVPGFRLCLCWLGSSLISSKSRCKLDFIKIVWHFDTCSVTLLLGTTLMQTPLWSTGAPNMWLLLNQPIAQQKRFSHVGGML